LLFKRGDEKVNKYGKAPERNLKFLDAVLNRETNRDKKDGNKKTKIVLKIIKWILIIGWILIFFKSGLYFCLKETERFIFETQKVS